MNTPTSIYDFSVLRRVDGHDEPVSLRAFSGKVLLVVNTATACGLTPQYEALEALYRTYKDRGFVILDFPCNQFMEQAKGSDEEINAFCSARYSTTFPRFKKIDVNGASEAPLYAFLKSALPLAESRGGGMMALILKLSSRLNGKSRLQSDIKWNFEKFLVDRNGRVVKRFAPVVKPEQLAAEIEALL